MGERPHQGLRLCLMELHDTPILKVTDSGKILFTTRVSNYGTETSWVGRQKNTCKPASGQRTWQSAKLPSWRFSCCGVCGEYSGQRKSRRETEYEKRSNDHSLLRS